MCGDVFIFVENYSFLVYPSTRPVLPIPSDAATHPPTYMAATIIIAPQLAR